MIIQAYYKTYSSGYEINYLCRVAGEDIAM